MIEYLGMFVTKTRTNMEPIGDRIENKFFYAKDDSSAILEAKGKRKKIERDYRMFNKSFRDRTSKTELVTVFRLVRIFSRKD